LIKFFSILLIFLVPGWAAGLEPEQILVVANGDIAESVNIAEYYCAKRKVPLQNVLKLKLGKELVDHISRNDYKKLIAGPVRNELMKKVSSEKIRCLLTIYGVPYKVGRRGVLKGEEKNLKKLRSLADEKCKKLKTLVDELDIPGKNKSDRQNIDLKSAVKMLKDLDGDLDKIREEIEALKDGSGKQDALEKWLEIYAKIYGKRHAWGNAQTKAGVYIPLTTDEKLKLELLQIYFNKVKKEAWGYGTKLAGDFYEKVKLLAGLNGIILRLDADINNISGHETNASVDSELSMVMFDDYPLYRWQKNELKNALFPELAKTLMVSRLDGPSEGIALGLVDKAIKAQREGLKGKAYIDKGYSLLQTKPLYKVYDDHMGKAADLIAGAGFMEVITDETKNVFGEGKCPQTALYCGWYSLRRYVDAFDFVYGAIGYHIASLEAVDLRDGQSTQWVPSMLTDGITVTMGAVAEPYLSAFPKPDRFFAELFKGKTVVEAYYRSQPFNSWQMVLIGDPLYRPFAPVDQVHRKR
jgi:uncharacterized protein (TIGR03790 family)